LEYTILRMKRGGDKTEGSPENAEPAAIGPHGLSPHQRMRVDRDGARAWFTNC
jgi:hypothetical protein